MPANTHMSATPIWVTSDSYCGLPQSQVLTLIRK